jgi:hypothetical protein
MSGRDILAQDEINALASPAARHSRGAAVMSESASFDRAARVLGSRMQVSAPILDSLLKSVGVARVMLRARTVG